MEDFYLPDYQGGSIVNLMSSISHKFGTKSIYPELRILTGRDIKSKNVVLLIIDGLGYEYLTKNHSESLLNSHLVGPMTSVFPPTTASAVTTFLTGVAPQQHALTGWFMNLKELGLVSCVLPFTARYNDSSLSESGVNIKSIIDSEPISARLKANCFIIQPEKLSKSDFSLAMSKKAKPLAFNDLEGMFRAIKRVIKSSGKRKYIYSYWPELDHLGHEKGITHKKVALHLREIDKRLTKFIKSLKGTDTTLIITADHGHMVSPPDKLVDLRNHPKLIECLSLPLCGEKRSAYCYVHPSKAKQFEDYVKEHLSKYVYLFKAEELIEKNFFGLGNQNKKLLDRIGDYVLIAKEDFSIHNPMLTEEGKKQHIGHHAGISKAEMLVPLIVINC